MEQKSNFLMPFGKYKGRGITTIPRPYLKWLWANCNLYGPLRNAVADQLGIKTEPKTPYRCNLISSAEFGRRAYKADDVEDIVRSWNPDQGETEVYE